MKRPNYVLRLLAVAALLAMALVGTAATTFASPPPSGGTAAQWDGTTSPKLYGANESDQSDTAFQDGAQEVYFASVANGVDFGLGAASTSITVQNIDVNDAYVFFWIGGSWDLDMTTYLGAGASKTFTAADLGIAEGEDVPVVAALYNQLGSVCGAGDLNGDGDCNDKAVPQENGGTRDEFLSRLEVPVYGAGVAKQAVAGTDLPYTSDADTSVSGYNAVSGREVGFWDDLYFPIVQTNCGPGGCWDTNMVVANVGLDNNAAVTISFFAADDGSGSLKTGFQIQKLLNAGDSWSVNLSSLVPEGWVGTAHIYTDDAVVAIANRFKAGTDMWITNSASNAVSESDWQNLGVVTPTGNVPYVLFAPDVRTDWNGWNVGINVSNTVDADNHVYVQYAGLGGNAPQGLDRRLAAQGMTYFYNPSDPSEDNCAQPSNSTTCEFIGAAVILSEYPVTVAVDGVKYFGDDNNVGQAFSYAATGNLYEFQSAPLIQKGTASTGMGATSGINFLNPNAGATTVQTRWVNPSGYTASNFSDSIVWVPGFSTGFVYTMNSGNLPNGFLGSAVVASTLPIAATTANVDYAVSGDGTAIWNLYNPCGFFRQDGDCNLGNILGPVVLNSTITVNVDCPTCTADDDITGTTVSVTGTDVNGYSYSADAAVSGLAAGDTTGTATISVPAGTFTVTVNPAAGYHNTTSPQTVTVAANSNATVNASVAPDSNTVGEGSLTKTFLDSAGNPVSTLLVTVTDENGNVTQVGPVDTDGTFTIDPINYGTYTLAWTDVSDPTDLVQYVNGSETITVPDVDGNSDVVVVNNLTLFAVLDVCVKDEEIDAPLAGANILVTAGDQEYTGTTDETGVAHILVDAAAAGTVYNVTASATDYTTSGGQTTVKAEDPAGNCGAEAETGNITVGDANILLGLDPVDIAADFGIEKTVEFNGAPVEGVEVAFVDLDGSVGLTAADCTVANANNENSVLNDTYENGSNNNVYITDEDGVTTYVPGGPAVAGTSYCVGVVTADGTVVEVDLVSPTAGAVGMTSITNEVSDVAGMLSATVLNDGDTVAGAFVDFYLGTLDPMIGCTGAGPVETMTGLNGSTPSFLVAPGSYCAEGYGFIGGVPPFGNYMVGGADGTVSAGAATNLEINLVDASIGAP